MKQNPRGWPRGQGQLAACRQALDEVHTAHLLVDLGNVAENTKKQDMPPSVHEVTKKHAYTTHLSFEHKQQAGTVN